MDADKLAPGHSLLALRGWGNPIAFQDVPHGLVTDVIAQVEQGAHYAVIPLRAVLAGHAHYEVFQLLVDAGTSNSRARLYTVTRLGNTFAVPGKDGIRLRNRRDLLQGVPAKLLPKRG